MITKVYNTTFKVDEASGFKGRAYKDATGKGIVQVTATPLVFSSGNGKVLMSGQITQFIDKRGKPIEIDGDSSFEDVSCDMLNFIVDYPSEKKYIKGNAKVSFTSDMSKGTAKVLATGKGYASLLVKNVVVNAILTFDSQSETPDNGNGGTTPPVDPPVTGTFNPSIGISGLTYYWYTALSDGTFTKGLNTIASICDSIGLQRGMVTFPLEVHSDGASPSASTPDWKNHYEQRCARILDAVRMINSYGFGVEVIVWNSNTPGKGYRKSWNKNDVSGNKDFIISKAKILIRNAGWERVTWLLCNEDDNSTHKDIRNALRNLKSDMSIPSDRVLSNDVHPSDVNKLPTLSKPQTFTSDNGPIISQLYDNKNYWAANGFNVENHKKVVDKYANVVLFNFYNLVLEETIFKHGSKWREVLTYYKSKLPANGPSEPTNPPVGGGLQPSQVKWLTSRGKDYKNAKTVFKITYANMNGKRLYFKTDKKFPEPWKEREKGVNSVGFLIRKRGNEYVGGKVEWCVETRGWYDIATNAKDGYNGHTMPQAGETVWCGIGHPDNGSECSTLESVVWPSMGILAKLSMFFTSTKNKTLAIFRKDND